MNRIKKNTNKEVIRLIISINVLLFAYIVLMTLLVIFFGDRLETRQITLFLSIYSGLFLMNIIIMMLLRKKVGLYIDTISQLSENTMGTDPITGMDKLEAIKEYVDESIFKEQKEAALCLFQLEDYKEISIIKGQEMADKIMKEMAKILSKKKDDKNILFSYSENEIGYIIPEYNDLEALKELISDFITLIKTSKVVKAIKADSLIGAGISIYPKDGLVLNDLLKKCELSLYRTKLTMEKNTILYDEKISDEIVYDVEITEQLSKAVDADEIHLKYQALVDKNQEIYGFESLARWSSPVVGDVRPDIFINSAEKNYMIVPLGNYILEESCKAQVALKERFDREFMMSVNVSLIQILQPGFLNVVKKIVKDTKINTDFLNLELTESIFINSTGDINEKFKELHELGIQLSLDDFGTGYSSMTYLQKIDFDMLKIDKSFVDKITFNKKDKEIIKSMIDLGHDLKMDVVVEGVENTEQLEYLTSISADFIQGYIYSEPLRLEDTYYFVDNFYMLSPKERISDIMKKND